MSLQAGQSPPGVGEGSFWGRYLTKSVTYWERWGLVDISIGWSIKPWRWAWVDVSLV